MELAAGNYLELSLFAAWAMLMGGLLFAGGAVAPVAVKVLSVPSAAAFLRAFWPRYYRFGATAGALTTTAMVLILATSSSEGSANLVMTALAALFTLGLWMSLATIPAINAARDGRDTEGFQRLHKRVLGLTAVSLAAGLVFLLLLGWALTARPA